ncbi:MAG: FAD-dependent oxidoreductase [Alphaproteobacteria bacterium]
MATISSPGAAHFTSEVDVLIVGAGACGLVAALAAAEAGASVAVLERDASPNGSTSMSSGFVPAAGTRFQAAQGVADSPVLFATDIQHKAKDRAAPTLVELATQRIGPTLEWLADRHGLEWLVLDDFLYPGHGRHRMHAVPEKTGEALLARLLAAANAADIPILTGAPVETLYAIEGRIAGARVRDDDIGCGALVLACNGYGGNRALVRRHIPVMADAPYYGHAGNQGDAVLWGEALGAGTGDLSACQGHGSLAHPHGILITWALMAEGGIQVNAAGRRFANEHQGYSEHAVDVLAQPGAIAWAIFDARLRAFAQAFPDFRQAEAAGAVIEAPDATTLATRIGASDLPATLAALYDGTDAFGRDFSSKPKLAPPYCAVKVTGALFHTQGGLMIDNRARVARADGRPFANLYAGGGAARGVSGPDIDGYLSGNGLLTAIAFGAIAGASAAQPAVE